MLIFTTICSVKILFTPQEDDIRTGYTPRGARSHVEAALYEKFYSGVGTQCDPMSIVLFLTALDGGTMHRETHLNESIRLLDEMGTRFKLAGKSFYQFCNHFCQINEPIRQFRVSLASIRHIQTTKFRTDFWSKVASTQKKRNAKSRQWTISNPEIE